MAPDSATVPPGDAFEVDRKTLRLRLDHFRTEHLNRLDAFRKTLSADQCLILDAMPLLLHSRHAALPGYVDADSPSGIDNYRPDATARRAVRQIALSYTEPRFVKSENQIQGLYLSRGHSFGSGNATHTPGALAPSRLRFQVISPAGRHPALAEKTRRIQGWAEARDVLIEIELIDPDSGYEAEATDTPNLELDAFYANALHLAGRFPLWWLVPLNQRSNHRAYCRRLLQQRFVKATDFFDLGDIIRIPTGEIFHAALEELVAALENPWRSLPHLLLLEAYAAEPETDFLSRRYKAWVTRERKVPSSRSALSGAMDLGSTPADLPALLLTQFLEAFLKPRHQLQRLALCQFPSSLTIEQRIKLGGALTAELQLALDHLLSLRSSRDGNRMADSPATDAELTTLAALEVKIRELDSTHDGALPVILPALGSIRPRGYLKLSKSALTWTLAGERDRVFQAPRLSAIAAWAVLQNLAAERVICTEATTRSALARMMEILTPFLRTPEPSTRQKGKRLQIFLNTEEEALDELTEQGDALLSDRNDALDFSGFHHILVQSVDLVQQDQHGRVYTSSLLAKELGDGLLGQALRHLYDPELKDIQLHTIGNLKRHQIDIRMRQLILDLRSTLEPGGEKTFILALGSGFLCCSLNKASVLEPQYLEDDRALFSLLGQSNSASWVKIDPNCLRLKPVAQALALAQAGRATLLIQASGVESYIYLVRENGSLNRFAYPTLPVSVTGMIDDLARFLDSQDLSAGQMPRIFSFQDHQLTEYPPAQALAKAGKTEPGNHRQSHSKSHSPISTGQLLAEYLSRPFALGSTQGQRTGS